MARLTDQPVAESGEGVGVSPRPYQGVMIDGVPCLLMYDSVKDETVAVDRDNPFYVQAMAAFSIIEMAFAPVLQKKSEKKTIIHVERPKLIRGLHS